MGYAGALTHAAFREQSVTVELLFSHAGNPLSALIRLSTWSRWSHVALVVDRDFVVEADAREGVRLAPFSGAWRGAGMALWWDWPAAIRGRSLLPRRARSASLSTTAARSVWPCTGTGRMTSDGFVAN